MLIKQRAGSPTTNFSCVGSGFITIQKESTLFVNGG